jgi:hypothetical protein
MKFARISLGLAGIAVTGLSVAACGSSAPTPAPAVTAPASSPSPAATQAAVSSPSAPAAAGGLGETLSSHDADVQACTGVQKTYAAFQADKSTDNENAFAISLAAVPGAAMTPSLFTAFQALSGDVQDAQLSGTQDPTSQADEQAVADGCAAAGVPMPAGFTG